MLVILISGADEKYGSLCSNTIVQLKTENFNLVVTLKLVNCVLMWEKKW